MTGIYKITSPLGMVYIGQARDIKVRWRRHRASKFGHGRIGYSFKCYPKAMHKFEVIHELPVDVSNENMNEIEKLYISQYKETGHMVLNDTKGGQSWAGRKHSAEWKRKISDIQKNRIWSPEQKSNVSKSVIASNKKRYKGGRKKKPPIIKLYPTNGTIVVHCQYGYFCTQREAAKLSGLSEQQFGAHIHGRRNTKNKTKFILA